MTGRTSLSLRAQADLDGIWDFTVHRWGVGQAEAYIRQIWRPIEILATAPTAGKPCPEVRQGYRKSRVGSRVLFYRVEDGAVDIVRILHESMDFDRHL